MAKPSQKKPDHAKPDHAGGQQPQKEGGAAPKRNAANLNHNQGRNTPEAKAPTHHRVG
jgi:hypothetical protein